MQSIFNIINEDEIELTKNLDNANTEQELQEYELADIVDLTNAIHELMDNKDRAPKKKIRPLLNEIATKALNAQDHRKEIERHLDESEASIENLQEATIGRLEEIDTLYHTYATYKMINIEDFLKQLDKLVY